MKCLETVGTPLGSRLSQLGGKVEGDSEGAGVLEVGTLEMLGQLDGKLDGDGEGAGVLEEGAIETLGVALGTGEGDMTSTRAVVVPSIQSSVKMGDDTLDCLDCFPSKIATATRPAAMAHKAAPTKIA